MGEESWRREKAKAKLKNKAEERNHTKNTIHKGRKKNQTRKGE
jgi:hypothetical protein